MSIPRNRPRPNAWVAAAFVTLLVGGCADYLNHRDRMTLAAGDDVQWNQAVHTIDPWPPGVGDDDIPGQGKRVDAVIERYEKPPPPAKATDVTVNVGANAGATVSGP